MNVIIIEDEKPSARRLKRILDKNSIDVKVILSSVNESIQWLLENKAPDLIFLDNSIASNKQGSILIS